MSESHGDENIEPAIPPEELIAARDELADDMLRSEAWFVSLAIQHMDPDVLAVKISALFNADSKPPAAWDVTDEAHRMICEYLESSYPEKIEAKALALRKEENE